VRRFNKIEAETSFSLRKLSKTAVAGKSKVDDVFMNIEQEEVVSSGMSVWAALKSNSV
jgi:hypothetical protein